MKKTKVCPMCHADLPPNHPLRSPASIMQEKSWKVRKAKVVRDSKGKFVKGGLSTV